MRGVISSSCVRVHRMRAMLQTTPSNSVPPLHVVHATVVCMHATHTDDLVRHLFLGSERQAPQVRASEKRSRTPCRTIDVCVFVWPDRSLICSLHQVLVSTTSLLTIVLERHRSTARDKRAAVPLSGVLLHRAPPSKDVGGGVVGHYP